MGTDTPCYLLRYRGIYRGVVGPSFSRAVDPRYWRHDGAGGDDAKAAALLKADVSGDGNPKLLPGFHLHGCADHGVQQCGQEGPGRRGELN